MALSSATLVPSTRSRRTSGVVAVVAPYGDGGRHAQEFARRGWESIAVTLPVESLPPAHRRSTELTGYDREIVHQDRLRRTAEKLRVLGVCAVVPGGGLGVELADRLARALDLPGNCPSTSILRRDRGVQAAALGDIGIPAPRSLRTDHLSTALGWADFSRLPAVVVTAADSSVTAPPAVCRNATEIRAAWEQLGRAARHQTGASDLMIQEYVPGRQFVVHSVSGHGPADHVVTGIWAEQRTPQHLHARSDLLDRRSLISRALSLYAARVLSALGIETGAARCRIAFVAGRGAVLLSARAYAQAHPLDAITRLATGTNPIHAAVDATVAGLGRPLTAVSPRFVSRLSLLAPHDGVLNGQLLREVTTLPTVARAVGPLADGAAVRRTVDRFTSPGELVLAARSQRAIDEDCRLIREAESVGLYDGGP